jgi:hypothetical protein
MSKGDPDHARQPTSTHRQPAGDLPHARRAARRAIDPDPDRLADLLRSTSRDYENLLEKVDRQAGWIIEKMQRLQASIARARDAGPSALSINGLGELQGQGPELDRLCGELDAQRQLVGRLNLVLGVEPPRQPRKEGAR